MKTEDKTENNQLIAEFMGLELEETLKGLMVYARKEQKDSTKENNIQTEFYEPKELLYHFSWDWLMPVVSYIVSDFEFNEQHELSDNEHRENIMDIIPFGRIEDTYDAVAQFIKWFNQK